MSKTVPSKYSTKFTQIGQEIIQPQKYFHEKKLKRRYYLVFHRFENFSKICENKIV